MIVVDLVNDNNYEDLWKQTLKIIENSNDPLKHNYISINLTDYISFPVVIENNSIICFSGAQKSKEKWGEQIIRLSTRLWRCPNNRITNLHKLSSLKDSLNIKYCIPIQLQKINELGIKCFFVSREKKHSGNVIHGFDQYCKLINDSYKTELKILPNLYNVCGNKSNNESCHQHISLQYTKKSLKIWNEQMKKFKIIC